MKKQELVDLIYGKNDEKGFWCIENLDTTNYGKDEYLMLIITKLGEVVTSYRRNNVVNPNVYEEYAKCDKSELSMMGGFYSRRIACSMEDNLALAYLSLIFLWGMYCDGEDIDDDGLLGESLDYVSCSNYKGGDFIRNIYNVVKILSTEIGRDEVELKHVILSALHGIEMLSSVNGINLEWFIEVRKNYIYGEI